MAVKVLVCLLAGLGAGLGTGFAGMSAAAVIVPILVIFLKIPSYEAIGIALASDVLASAVSAITYGKNKNLDIKNGLVLMFTVIAFTFVGSYIAKLVPNNTMGNISVFMTMILGIKFVVKPVVEPKALKDSSLKSKIIKSIISGSLIGFICGFVGAGGGMMMLLILTTVLGYDLKTAVGTSVFVMSFTALTGAISHFIIGDSPDILILVLCVLFTLIFAQIASKIANKSKPIILNRITGIILIVISVTIIIVNLVV